MKIPKKITNDMNINENSEKLTDDINNEYTEIAFRSNKKSKHETVNDK